MSHRGDNPKKNSVRQSKPRKLNQSQLVAQALEAKNQFCEQGDQLLAELQTELKGHGFEVASVSFVKESFNNRERKVYIENSPDKHIAPQKEKKHVGRDNPTRRDVALWRELREYVSQELGVQAAYLLDNTDLAMIVIESGMASQRSRESVEQRAGEIVSRLAEKSAAAFSVRFVAPQDVPSIFKSWANRLSVIYDVCQEVDACHRAAKYYEQHMKSWRNRYKRGYVAVLATEKDDFEVWHGRDRSRLLARARRAHPDYGDRVFVQSLSELPGSVTPLQQ